MNILGLNLILVLALFIVQSGGWGIGDSEGRIRVLKATDGDQAAFEKEDGHHDTQVGRNTGIIMAREKNRGRTRQGRKQRWSRRNAFFFHLGEPKNMTSYWD